MHYDVWMLLLGAAAGLACGFLNTAASSGSAVSLPILIFIGLDPLSANATNRIPVLVGALTATVSFHRRGAINWPLAWRIALPVTLGAFAGAAAATVLPLRDLGLIITGALLVALLLLFTKLKQALARAVPLDVEHYCWRDALLFAAIGFWLGFIVLDGATYLLLALVLAVGLPLLSANAIKSFALVPTALASLALFAWRGAVDWRIGAAMALGAILGGLLGARLAAAPHAKRYVYVLLVLVMLGELVNLAVHYWAALA